KVEEAFPFESMLAICVLPPSVMATCCCVSRPPVGVPSNGVMGPEASSWVSTCTVTVSVWLKRPNVATEADKFERMLSNIVAGQTRSSRDSRQGLRAAWLPFSWPARAEDGEANRGRRNQRVASMRLLRTCDLQPQPPLRGRARRIGRFLTGIL